MGHHRVGGVSPFVGMTLDPFPRLFSDPGIIPQSQGNGRLAKSQLLGKDRYGHYGFFSHSYPSLKQ
jgi:hypothetical protein